MGYLQVTMERDGTLCAWKKNSVIFMVQSLKNQISIFKNQAIFKSQLTNLLKPV